MQKKKGSVRKWLEKNKEILIMTGVSIVGTAIFSYGFKKGRTKGLVEFRSWHMDISKKLVDECGSIGAFEALDLVRSDANVYKELLENPDGVLKLVQKRYYANGYIKNVISALK